MADPVQIIMGHPVQIIMDYGRQWQTQSRLSWVTQSRLSWIMADNGRPSPDYHLCTKKLAHLVFDSSIIPHML